MKTAMAETSINAYRDHRMSGGTARQRNLVLAKLCKYKRGRTNAEIGESLGLPASTVSGRVNELKQAGTVVELGRRKCRVTGNTAKVHGVAK